jgi:hypothetical protein
MVRSYCKEPWEYEVVPSGANDSTMVMVEVTVRSSSVSRRGRARSRRVKRDFVDSCWLDSSFRAKSRNQGRIMEYSRLIQTRRGPPTTNSSENVSLFEVRNYKVRESEGKIKGGECVTRHIQYESRNHEIRKARKKSRCYMVPWFFRVFVFSAFRD